MRVSFEVVVEEALLQVLDYFIHFGMVGELVAVVFGFSPKDMEEGHHSNWNEWLDCVIGDQQRNT